MATKKRLSVDVTDAQYEVIKSSSEKLGMSMASYLRYLASKAEATYQREDKKKELAMS